MDYLAESVDEAIALAETFKAEGKYNWFRGQVQLWPPRSSLARHSVDKPEGWRDEIIGKYGRYFKFLHSHGELAALAADPEAAFAVAQHHGIATTLIDFTTDPAVAGFFACDTEKPLPPDAKSCIFCLNTDELSEFWDDLNATGRDYDINLLKPAVKNLWRIESQHGVFLEISPANWDDFFGMDRILFPHCGAPVFPPREVIYPVNKSALEILIDQFLAAEAHRESGIAFQKFLDEIGTPTTWVEPPADRVEPSFFKDGTMPVDQSWNADALERWQDDTREEFGSGGDRVIPLVLDNKSLPLSVGKSVATAVRAASRTFTRLRNERVSWHVKALPLNESSAGNGELEVALRQFWDGMRRLPYSDDQLAAGMGRTAELFTHGLCRQIGPQKEREIAQSLYGEIVRLEFDASDGSYTRAHAGSRAISDAWRRDLLERLAPIYRHKIEDPTAILMAISDPRRLFDFGRLCALFPEMLVPWQILTRGDPFFFSPVRLSAFGLQ